MKKIILDILANIIIIGICVGAAVGVYFLGEWLK
jgi:hypothetical protein